jgi:predicted amidohydrolase YtcJ
MPERTLFVGRVFTSHPSRFDAGAVLVEDGRITAVGEERDFGAIGPRIRIDLPPGSLLCPAFTDSHTHFVQWALQRRRVDLSETRSLSECLRLIADAEKTLKPGEWLRGRGWSVNDWNFPEMPTARDLESVVGKRPVLLFSHDGHCVWLSPAAMEHVGLCGGTQDPPGGVFVRDELGNPTGVACEEAVIWVDDRIPRASISERADAVTDSFEAAWSVGVTGVGDYGERDDWEVYDELRRRELLRIRAWKTVPKKRLGEMIGRGFRTGDGDEWFRAGALKLYADGALGSRTAHMLQPFEGTDDTGVSTLSDAELDDYVERASVNGLAVAVHAIGDAANRRVLDAFERARERYGPSDLRHRIEHAQLLHADDISRFSPLEVLASVQPSHLLSDREAADRLWGGRSVGAFAFRSLIDSGARYAFGSDAPIERLNPIEGILAAVNRAKADEKPWHPEQRLTVEQALMGFTAHAAWAHNAEGERGIVAPGMHADLVVLDSDPRAVPPEDIGDMRVLATYLEGERVFGSIS